MKKSISILTFSFLYVLFTYISFCNSKAKYIEKVREITSLQNERKRIISEILKEIRLAEERRTTMLNGCRNVIDEFETVDRQKLEVGYHDLLHDEVREY